MGLLHNGDVAAVAGYEEVGIYRKAATKSRVVKLIQELKTGQLSSQVGVLCCVQVLYCNFRCRNWLQVTAAVLPAFVSATASEQTLFFCIQFKKL